MQLNRLKWREFITLLGGALAAWSLAARAARAELMRRIGVLMNTAPDDAEGQARLAAFQLGLAQFGWTDGRNMQLEIRWSAAGDADRLRKAVSELVALAPDVILASATSSVAVAQQATRTVPIVFAMVLDPVGGGIVESLARPGGNATGFMLYEYSLSGKWLELLNQITPSVTRAAVLRDHNLHTGHAQFAVIQAMAPSLGVEVIPINVDRARHHDLRTFREGWVDRDGERAGDVSSQSDRRPGGQIQAARGLLQSLLRRRRRRPDLLWD
jgi:putative tryptophan/tyrosine transport system substrate-binding protein